MLFDLSISYEYGRYTENLKDQILFFLGTRDIFLRRDREADLAYIAQQRRFRARYLISEFSRRTPGNVTDPDPEPTFRGFVPNILYLMFQTTHLHRMFDVYTDSLQQCDSVGI